MKAVVLTLASTLLFSTSAYTAAPKPDVNNRRAFLSKIAGATIAAATTSLNPSDVAAATGEDDNLQNVYFGAGCYWHVRELVVWFCFFLNTIHISFGIKSSFLQHFYFHYILLAQNMNSYLQKDRFLAGKTMN